MPRLVENVGEPLFAGWLSRVYRLADKTNGTRWVCGRRVRWLLDVRSGLAVEHLASDPSETVRYTVALQFTGLPSGGDRWWWACPGCQHRVDVLYLPSDRDRFGCRRCCGLYYQSQYTGRKRRKRKRRPVVEAVPVVTRWVWYPNMPWPKDMFRS